MDTQQKQEIEYVLGRPLTTEELVPVSALEDLTPAEKLVAEDLARRQLALCTLYLRSVAPIGVPDAMQFIDEFLTTEREKCDS